MGSNTDWQSIVFSSGWLHKLDRLAAKRFGDGGLAEEAGTYVIEKLSTNNWNCLSSFKGQCKAESYLHTVSSNFLEEFSRQRFGRARPPEWLKRQGALWVQIWKMVCLERQLVQSVIEHMSLNNLREPGVIKSAISTIKARLPWCGSATRELIQSTSPEDEYDPAQLISDQQTPESEITHAVYTDALLSISCLLNDKPVENMFGEQAAVKAANYVKNKEIKFESLRHQLKLTAEEKILLRMVFQDGLKKSVIAKSLGMQEHLPGRILKSVLERISQVFSNNGINLDEIRDLSNEFCQ